MGITSLRSLILPGEVAARNTLDSPEVRVKLGLRQGEEQVSVERTNVLNVSGILRLTGDVWQVINHDSKLAVSEADKPCIRCCFPVRARTPINSPYWRARFS